MTMSMNTQEFQCTKETPWELMELLCRNKPSSALTQNPAYTNDDIINHPAHYTEGRKYEPLDVIEDWELDYLLGNTLKYISRAGRKGKENELVDLLKALFYLNRHIDKIRKANAGSVD